MARRGLYLQPFSGIAGDMFLASLLDCGLELDALTHAIDSLGIDGVKLEPRSVLRGALRGTKLDVIVRRADGREVQEGRHHHHGEHGHGGSHHHHHEPNDPHGRGLGEILGLIEQSQLTPRAKDIASQIFRVLGESEAHVHGVTLDQVHFHEVGALDSIVDICGAAVAVDLLGINEVRCDAIGVGEGTRRMSHGVLPLPAPATASILEGFPLRSTGIADEFVTPTGAAILRVLVDEFGPPREWRMLRTGYGAGSTERADPPNVLRATLYECEGGDDVAEYDQVEVLETQIDDATPEALAFLREQLEDAGALDVVMVAATMKKGRRGEFITVLARGNDGDRLTEILHRDGGTFGVRRRSCDRSVLARRIDSVDTVYGVIRVKVGLLRDAEILRVPEYEDLAAAARRHGVSLETVRQEALLR